MRWMCSAVRDMTCRNRIMKLGRAACRFFLETQKQLLLYYLFQIMSYARVIVDHYHWDISVGKCRMGYNLATKLATQNLHHEHEEICLRKLFPNVSLKNKLLAVWCLAPSCCNHALSISAPSPVRKGAESFYRAFIELIDHSRRAYGWVSSIISLID
jgi:hypothetical protein